MEPANLPEQAESVTNVTMFFQTAAAPTSFHRIYYVSLEGAVRPGEQPHVCSSFLGVNASFFNFLLIEAFYPFCDFMEGQKCNPMAFVLANILLHVPTDVSMGTGRITLRKPMCCDITAHALITGPWAGSLMSISLGNSGL